MSKAVIPSVVPIAVLGSGRGSNFDAIQRAITDGRLSARIVAVVSDREHAPILDKARAAGIPALHVAPINTPPAPGAPPLPARRVRETHDQNVLQAVEPYAPRFLVMAGYFRVVTPVLIEAFRDSQGYSRIVNVHPSLLPAFPGLDAYAQAYHYGAQCSGVTVHLVEEDVDTGPICAQETFSLAGCVDAAAVEQRGLAVEHRLFPQALHWIVNQKFGVETRVLPRTGLRRLCVRPD